MVKTPQRAKVQNDPLKKGVLCLFRQIVGDQRGRIEIPIYVHIFDVFLRKMRQRDGLYIGGVIPLSAGDSSVVVIREWFWGGGVLATDVGHPEVEIRKLFLLSEQR